jgi:hypothetical protein
MPNGTVKSDFAFVLAGTYSLYRAFSRQLREREETILSPEL